MHLNIKSVDYLYNDIDIVEMGGRGYHARGLSDEVLIHFTLTYLGGSSEGTFTMSRPEYARNAGEIEKLLYTKLGL